MSSCLSGGGRAYRLNLELIKSPTTTTTFSTSNSSSPSSTLSESSNSPLSIFTRKARTPRKRPNQTYNEAAAILSTAYPKIFPTKPSKFTKSHDKRIPFLSEPSDLLIPFRVIDNNSGYLLQFPPIQERPDFRVDSKRLNPFEKTCQSPGEVDSRGIFSEICDEFQEDFDAESMLDEEVEEGIDSIMGNLRVENEKLDDFVSCSSMQVNNYCNGFPVGLGFGFGCGMRREFKAMRNVDEGDWWRFPSVNLADITQKYAKIPVEKKKKRRDLESGKRNLKENLGSIASSEESIKQPNAGLMLKLNHDDVLNAWSDKGTPFSGDSPASHSAGNDVQARLAQIDLFPDNGAERGAIVLRYKEKRRTRLFSKKIRYEVRKVNADQRPRMKGRFVRTPNSHDDD